MAAITAIVATTIAEIDFSSIAVIVAIAAIIWKPLSSDHTARLSDLKLSTGIHCVRSRFSKWLPTQTSRKQSPWHFMEEVQKYDCLYIKFSKEYRDKYKKINCWKTIGEKFDLFPEHEFSVFPVDNDYKKTHLK